MLIHAFKRKDPIEVTIGTLFIQFKPNGRKDVVATVTDDKAIERLLSISEAYREYEEGEEPSASAAPAQSSVPGESADETANIAKAKMAADEDARLLASRAQTLITHSNADVLANLEGITADELLDRAFKRSGLSKSGWNAQEQVDIDTALDTELNAIDLAASEQRAAADAKNLPTKYVVATPDGNSVDLAKMDDKKLRAFAKTLSLTIPPAAKGNKIRDLIIAAVKPE